MTDLLLRGRTLSFLRWPDNADDHAAYAYEEDGGLLVRDGKIVAAGAYAEVAAQAGEGVATDRPPAASASCRASSTRMLHFPQMQVIASYGAELLDWLNTYTFPEETKFADAAAWPRASRGCSSTRWCATARRRSRPIARCTRPRPRPSSPRRMSATCCMIAGKVMMDRNAPDGAARHAAIGL